MIEDWKASYRLGPHKTVKSWSFLLVCTFAVPMCLSTFIVLEKQIHANSSPTANLQIFDLRNGYSPDEVYSTLQAWGFQGRMLYLVIEFVDCTVYHFAYRGAFLVILNRMSDQISKRWRAASPIVSAMSNVPFFLAWIDLFEDIGQASTSKWLLPM